MVHSDISQYIYNGVLTVYMYQYILSIYTQYKVVYTLEYILVYIDIHIICCMHHSTSIVNYTYYVAYVY